MNDKVAEILNGSHVMAEITRMNYDSFKDQGFDDKQCLYYTGIILKAIIAQSVKGNSEDDST